MSEYGSFGEGFSSAFAQQQQLAQRNAAMQQQQQLQLTEQINKNIGDLYATAAAVAKANSDAGNPPDAIANQIHSLQSAAVDLATNAANKGVFGPNGQQMVAGINQRFSALSGLPALQDKNNYQFQVINPNGVFGPSQVFRGNKATGSGELMPMQGGPQSPVGETPRPGQANLGEGAQVLSVQNIPPGAPAIASSVENPAVIPPSAQQTGTAPQPLPIESRNIPVQSQNNFNESVLNGLPENTKAAVKMMANYENIKGYSTRNNVLGDMIALAKRYNPDFDVKAFHTAQKTMDQFATGQAGIGIRALNNTIGHTQQWLADLRAIENFGTEQFGVGTQAANKLRNWMLANKQDPRVIAVETDQQVVGTELEKALRGSNTSEKLIEEWKNRLAPTLAPEQGAAVTKAITGLLGTALKNYGEQWNSGFRTASGKQIKYRDPITFLSPENQQTYDQMINNKGVSTPASTQQPVDWRTYFQQGK